MIRNSGVARNFEWGGLIGELQMIKNIFLIKCIKIDIDKYEKLIEHK